MAKGIPSEKWCQLRKLASSSQICSWGLNWHWPRDRSWEHDEYLHSVCGVVKTSSTCGYLLTKEMKIKQPTVWCPHHLAISGIFCTVLVASFPKGAPNQFVHIAKLIQWCLSKSFPWSEIGPMYVCTINLLLFGRVIISLENWPPAPTLKGTFEILRSLRPVNT